MANVNQYLKASGMNQLFFNMKFLKKYQNNIDIYACIKDNYKL